MNERKTRLENFSISNKQKALRKRVHVTQSQLTLECENFFFLHVPTPDSISFSHRKNSDEMSYSM